MGAADTNPMAVVEVWDRALRAGDWDTARAALADDATYTALDDEGATCTGAEQIVGLMRSWKGTVPTSRSSSGKRSAQGSSRTSEQPAWDDATWFQVLTVEGGLIRRLEDHPTREAALAAMGGTET